MKLKFSKQDDAVITQLEINEKVMEFEYLIFINKLIEGETLEESEYPEDITELEKKEIEQMIVRINEVISSLDEEESPLLESNLDD